MILDIFYIFVQMPYMYTLKSKKKQEIVLIDRPEYCKNCGKCILENNTFCDICNGFRFLDNNLY